MPKAAGPVERHLKPGKDIVPLSLNDFDAVHAELRRHVATLLPMVKGRVPVQFLKQPQKYDSAMAARLVDAGVHPDKRVMQAAVVWHRHYTEIADRPSGPELLLPTAAIDAIEAHGDQASAKLIELAPWLDKKKMADSIEELPAEVARMLQDASERSSSHEVHIDFAAHELLASLGTTMQAPGARALAWYKFHTEAAPQPDGPPMLPWPVQRAVISGIAEHRASVLNEFADNEFETSKLDDELKDSILKAPDCSALVRQLSADRPSVFDLLASAFRYRPELVEVQRRIMLEIENGAMDVSDGCYKVFMETVPDSQRIIRDMQQEANANAAASADKVNIVD